MDETSPLIFTPSKHGSMASNESVIAGIEIIANNSCYQDHLQLQPRFNAGETNLLVKQTQSESCLFLSSGTKLELTESDQSFGLLASVIDVQHELTDTNILCIDKSNLIPINLVEMNQSPRSVSKSEAFESHSVKGSERESSASLRQCSEEVKITEQISPSNLPPLWGLISICGRRLEMEDSVIALPRFLKIPARMLSDNPRIIGSGHEDVTADLFGVFDGHGGCQVANYCREHLHVALAEEISFPEANFSSENDEDNWKEQWGQIFLNCFRKMDNQVGGFPHVNANGAKTSNHPPSPPVAPNSVGSTAVVAIVCATYIIVANCGDSRAVLCRGKTPVPLSVDHKLANARLQPNREDECVRIEAAGGKVINWDGYRVSGVLAMSRSIGDRYLKPYVIADPELMFVPRAKEDECLIIASDGLWDVLNNDEACDLARRRILLWYRKNGDNLSEERGEDIDPASQDAADYLSELAYRRGSSDNITVIVVDLKAQRKIKKKS